MNTNRSAGYLSDVSVVEIGSRISASVCGMLLAEAGANVFFVEPHRDICPTSNKWASRSLYAAGKNSVVIDVTKATDSDTLIELIKAVDVVLLSSDVDSDLWKDIATWKQNKTIICDFTAFGKNGPLAGQPLDDAMVQAMSGVAHTTGFADGPPVTLQVPLLEYSTGVYGATAILAALTVRDQSGIVQNIDMALYDSGVNSLSTFLPSHFGGGVPMRVGNQHSMCAPWNAYQASDGWLLLCSASNPPWQRLCKLMGKPEFADDPKFTDLTGRMANRDEVNQIVQNWVGQYTVAQSTEVLMAADIACGPILRMEDGEQDPNLQHRSMIKYISNPNTGNKIRIPGPLLKANSGIGCTPEKISVRDEAHEFAKTFIRENSEFTHESKSQTDSIALPLKGIRVLEIGQYTTAPLPCKHLATLGAEVLKIEPPEGDAARVWLPHNGDLSYFFVMNNAGKTSLAIDLKTKEGKEIFTSLLENSDMLLENLKPGSLARLGFDKERLAEINPRLIYCAISGFGSDSVYEGRPAFDTVVQAMAGMMSANASEGTPLKSGVSACDFMGGEVGLFFVLAALRNRKRTGRGDYIDLSMQDVAVWITASLWHIKPDRTDLKLMLKCLDGYVCIANAPDQLHKERNSNNWKSITRTEAIEKLTSMSVLCVPVQTISEMLEHTQTKSRSLLHWHDAPNGLHWPLLGSPMTFSRMQLAIDEIIGHPQPVNTKMRARLNI